MMVRGMNKMMVPKTARNPSLNENISSISGNKTNPTLYIHKRIVADHILFIENNWLMILSFFIYIPFCLYCFYRVI